MKNIFSRKKDNKRNIIFKYVIPVIVALLLFLIIRFGILNKNYVIEQVGLDKYISLVTSSKETLIFYTSNDCEMCQNASDIFKKVLNGSKIKMYEVNIDNFKDEDLVRFMDALDITKEGAESPLLAYVKEGQAISISKAPFDEDRFIEFLQLNNLVD